MVSLAYIQPTKRRPDGPIRVLRYDDGGETQFWNVDEAEAAYIQAMEARRSRKAANPPFSSVLADLLKELTIGRAKGTMNNLRYHASFLVEAFGDRPIRSITLAEVKLQRLVLMAYHSPTVAPNAMNLLSRTMWYAFEHSYVDLSSCFEVPPPPMPEISSARRVKARPQPVMLGTSQIRTMLLNGVGNVGLFTRFGLLAGTRCGEALGVDWDAIDWKNEEVDIRQSFGAHGDGKVKTIESNRILPLPGPLMTNLRDAHRSAGCPTRGPVFLNSKGRRVQYDTMKFAFYLWQCELGFGSYVTRRLESTGRLKYRFKGVWTTHALRHSAAGLLIMAGVPDTVIKSWLGHVYLSETLETYGHLFGLYECGFREFPAVKEEMADAVQ